MPVKLHFVCDAIKKIKRLTKHLYRFTFKNEFRVEKTVCDKCEPKLLRHTFKAIELALILPNNLLPIFTSKRIHFKNT